MREAGTMSLKTPQSTMHQLQSPSIKQTNEMKSPMKANPSNNQTINPSMSLSNNRTVSLPIPTLNFKCPARQSITQAIPLINPSLIDWQWRARIDGTNFSCDQSVNVTSQSNSQLVVKYQSNVIQTVNARLILKNRQTNDELVFKLVGESTSPVCESVILINQSVNKSNNQLVNLIARERSNNQTISLNNDTASLIEYRVETDLPGFIGETINSSKDQSSSYSNSQTPNQPIRVPPFSFTAYQFSVQPMLAGHFACHLTFTANDPSISQFNNQSIKRWWAVKLDVCKPKPISPIKLKCQARASVTASLEIPYPSIHQSNNRSSNQANSEPIEFFVELTGDRLSGADRLIIQPNEVGTYEISYSPFLTGQSVGYVSFLHVQPNNQSINQAGNPPTSPFYGEFVYEIEMECVDSPIIELPPVKCEIGQSVDQSIWIRNPSDSLINLTPQFLIIQSIKQSSSQLSHRGNSRQSTKQSVNHVSTEIDQSNSWSVDLSATQSISQLVNQTNNQSIVIQPNGVFNLIIKYTPTQIHVNQTVCLVLTDRRIGTIRYQLSGTGLAPLSELAINGALLINQSINQSDNQFSTFLGVSYNKNVMFRNPFNQTMEFEVRLEEDENQSLGQSTNQMSLNQTLSPKAARSNDIALLTNRSAMLTNRSSNLSVTQSIKQTIKHAFTLTDYPGKRLFLLTLAPRANQLFNITFKPRLIDRSTGCLIVSCHHPSSQSNNQSNTHSVDRSISWRYPLIGEGEGVIDCSTRSLTCPARQSVDQSINIVLPGLSRPNSQSNNQPLRSDMFTATIEPDNDGVTSAAINQMLHVRLSSIGQSDQSNNNQLVAHFHFCPLKPVTTQCVIVIRRLSNIQSSNQSISQSSGVWRFPLRLIVSDPIPDDELNLSAGVGGTDSVSFRVRNIVDRAAKYRAYLTTNSSPFFSISPKTGRLPPKDDGDDQSGQLFTVTFKPLEYGKEVYMGTMLIETDDALIAYSLKGTPPKHKVPVGKSKIVR